MTYHVARDGTQLGTFTIDQIRDGLSAGLVQTTDLAWAEGMPDWQPVSSLGISVTPAGGPPPVPAIPAAPQIPSLPPAAFAGQVAGPSPDVGESGTSGKATASMILGLVSCALSCFTAVPAIILGHIALSNIKKSGGRLTGKGLAITGLILGYLQLAALPIMFAIALPAFVKVQAKSQELVATNLGRQVITSLKIYAADHNGKYPAALHDLVNEGHLPTASSLTFPAISGWTGENSWDYFGANLSDSSNGSDVLISSQCSGPRGERIIGYNDGTVVVERSQSSTP